MRTRLRFPLVVLLGALALAAWAASAHATHSWGGYHWARTSNPFTLKLGSNLTSAWTSFLTLASADWSRSAVLDTTVVSGLSLRQVCYPTLGRVEVCNYTYGRTGWLGVAQIWISGLHILQGTVKLNDTYFNMSTYNKPQWRQLVVCQEVAHTFGLDHQDENFNNANLGTCMDYTSNPLGPPDNEHPNQHDYDELGIIYSHLDSTTTVKMPKDNRMPPAMADIHFATPAQWGKLIRSSNDGRTALYELDFGRGFKVFTRVIWAE